MPRATRSRKAEMDASIPEPESNGDGEVATEETPKVAAERVQITKAPDTVVAFCRRVMKEHHEELADAGVTIAVNWAAAGENAVGAKPALKFKGHPVLATIKKASEKETAQDMADLTITIDKHRWKDITDDEEMQAAIDACLCSVSLRREGNTEDGAVQQDANDRPKLKLMHPDLLIMGYKANVERFRRKAPPTKQLLKFEADNKQLLMSFAGGD